MDCFALLWMFDSRWLFGIRPSLFEHLLIVPMVTNLLLLATTIYDRVQTPCLVQKWRLAEVMVLKAVLMFLEIGMYTLLLVRRHRHNQKLPTVNRQRISDFYREFECRKVVWSWAGLFVFLLSFSLLWVSLVYATWGDCTIFGPKIYFYVNLSFWMYISIMVFGFLLSKGIYLVAAWKCPAGFLRLQNLYPQSK